jgi:methyltransferase (TIGR00027 family)
MEAVSRTAQWTAAARALESERPDRIFDDPWARTVAGDVGFDLLERYQGAAVAPFIAVRTKYIDDAVMRAVAESGARQVVLVAAGMDTRAGRLPWPDDVVLFELDRPALIEAKDEILPETVYRPRCARHAVPVDLAGEWAQPLRDAGLDVTRPVTWVVEGLFFFLDQAEAHALLRGMAGLSAPGSVLIGDFVSRASLVNPFASAFLHALREDGNPWRFGTDKPAETLSEAGWRPSEITQPGEETASFGRWELPVPPADRPHVPRSFLFTATLDR